MFHNYQSVGNQSNGRSINNDVFILFVNLLVTNSLCLYPTIRLDLEVLDLKELRLDC